MLDPCFPSFHPSVRLSFFFLSLLLSFPSLLSFFVSTLLYKWAFTVQKNCIMGLFDNGANSQWTYSSCERSYCAWLVSDYIIFYLEEKKKRKENNVQEQVTGCLAPLSLLPPALMLTCMEAHLFLEQVFFVSFFFNFYFVILLGNVMFCTCAMQLYRNIFHRRAGANCYLSSFYLICKTTASAFRECRRQSDTRLFC